MPRIKLWPDKDVVQEKITIKTGKRYIKALVIKPKDYKGGAACVLWIHGGGFATGMKEMAYMTRAIDLVKQYAFGNYFAPQMKNGTECFVNQFI